jgi:hypothetical protein
MIVGIRTGISRMKCICITTVPVRSVCEGNRFNKKAYFSHQRFFFLFLLMTVCYDVSMSEESDHSLTVQTDHLNEVI